LGAWVLEGAFETGALIKFFSIDNKNVLRKNYFEKQKKWKINK